MMAGMSRAAALGLGVLALQACAPRAPADPVILALGDQVVRRSEFEAHLEELKGRGLEQVSEPAVRRTLLDAFVEQRLLVLEARQRGRVAPEDGVQAELDAAQALLAEAAARVEVSDAEVEAYYAEHGQELSRPEELTLRQILVPTLNEARDVRRRLAKDPRSFEALAQTRSRGPEASAGGLMGTFARGQLPTEIEEVAFGLVAGRVSEPLQTPLGYHVLRVDERRPGRERSLDECRAEIERDLIRQKSEAAQAALVRGLLACAKVNHEAAQNLPRP
jgi:parvulin-like peptidyl-prolyl isomerase